MTDVYSLPKLPYDYKALEPVMSEEQLKLHHQKHHNSYVNNANALIQKLRDARKNSSEISMKHILKDLAFNVAGHVLHSLFWKNLKGLNLMEKVEGTSRTLVLDGPKNPKVLSETAGFASNEPKGNLLEEIKKEFGSFERFKKEFSEAALSVEGSGWATLVKDKEGKLLIIAQIEK